MGTILTFPVGRVKASPAGPVAQPAEILFFTGVRIERTATPPDSAATTPASISAPRTKQRR